MTPLMNELHQYRQELNRFHETLPRLHQQYREEVARIRLKNDEREWRIDTARHRLKALAEQAVVSVDRFIEEHPRVTEWGFQHVQPRTLQ